MNKPNKMWFQGQMYEQHLSARKLASRIGIDPSAMSNMLNGKRALKSEEAAKLAEIFNVTTDEVLSQAGVSVHQRPAGEASTAVGGSSVRPQRPTKVQHAGQRLISVPLPSGKTIAIEFEEGTSLEEWRLASRFIEGFF